MERCLPPSAFEICLNDCKNTKRELLLKTKICFQYMLPPMMMDNCTNEYLQNQSATTAMNPYGSQTENSYYYDASLYQQQESSSRESSSLPNIQTLLTQSITNNPLQVRLSFILYKKI
jgi:hypothetical protein